MISVKKVVKKNNKKIDIYITKITKKVDKIKKETSKRIRKIKKFDLKKETSKLVNKLKNLDYKKETKKILLKSKELLKKYYYLILMALPFTLIDLITRIMGHKINFYSIDKIVPNLFTITWVF